MSFRGKKIVGVIPARVGSQRLPRKMLADICGLPMIVHVLKRVQMSSILDEVFVATDSDEIGQVVEACGGRAIMTSSEHSTGIERCEEALRGRDYDVAVLVNGDEVGLDPDHIEVSVATLLDSDAPTALLASAFSKGGSYSNFKVVLNKFGEAMYFSREDIPSPSRSGVGQYLKAYHIISFRMGFLSEYVKLDKTPLEVLEGHDHLRLLENGIKVKIGVVDHASFSVDTYDDLELMREEMAKDPIFRLYDLQVA